MKNSVASFTLVFLSIAFMAALHAQPQRINGHEKMKLYHETPRDAYMPHPDPENQVSPAYSYRASNIITRQVNVNQNGQNILNDAANEPSIGINPLNPNEMVIGWRQFNNVASNFRQAGYAYTSDAGQTWTFPGVIEPGVFRSDPVLEYNADGTVFYNSLTSNMGTYTCQVFKSSTGGVQWDAGTQARGGDKQWMEIDKSGGIGNGNIYAFWTTYYSSCYPGNFTRSTDNGLTYEECSSVEGDPYWGTLAIGPDGELYVAGSGIWDGFTVVKSTTAQYPGMFIMWDFDVNVSLDGELTYGATVNPGGLMGQAIIDVDRSGGPGNGNVYLLASVKRTSNNDPGDVMFSRSIDGGATWSAPQRINTDLSTTNTQWFGTMSVAPNGRIDVIWLDTRDAPLANPNWSALYYSYSVDYGITWSPNEKLSELFNPHLGWPNQQKMGDYFDMVSHNDGVHLAWAATFTGGQDVYYSKITPDITATGPYLSPAHQIDLICKPNPVSGTATLAFTLPNAANTSIVLSNMAGAAVMTIVDKHFEAGYHSYTFSAAQLPSGLYLCRIDDGQYRKTIRIAVTK